MLNKLEGIFDSLIFKITVIMAVVLLMAVVALNYFPAAVTRQQMIAANETQLETTAGSLSALLESAAELDAAEMASAVELLRLSPTQRALVIGTDYKVRYDSLELGSIQGSTALFSPVIHAMEQGEPVRRCVDKNEAFESEIAMPFYRQGRLAGVVYLYWRTTDDVALLQELRQDMTAVSIALAIAVGMILLTLMVLFRHRLDRLVRGVRRIGSGDYTHMIEMGSMEDELAEVAAAVNDMGRRLEKNENQRRQFLSDASHELKTPLASIQLLTDSIIQAPNMPREDAQEFLVDISEEIKRLTRITEDLMQLSRMEGAKPPEFTTCDLAAAVKRCAELLRITAVNHHVTVVNGCTAPVFIRANRDLLHRVVFNLMENAIKYNRPGGTVTVMPGRKDEWVTMTVEDTGVGIPEDAQGKLFERFFRVDKNRSRKVGGSGLGLAIVKECVDAMGGEISVHSLYQVGTVFTVYFRAEEVEEA